MAAGRVIVIEGPDQGREFAIPLRGGTIGRDDDNLIRLTDPAVSRTHCRIDLRHGRLVIVEAGSRNATRINGRAVREHILASGDEILVGQTRLTFVTVETPAANDPSVIDRVTMEVSSEELLAVKRDVDGPHTRAYRHLRTLAQLGDSLRGAETRTALCRAACETLREAVAGDHVHILRVNGPRLVLESSTLPADTDSPPIIEREIIKRVADDGRVVALEGQGIDQNTTALVAPLRVASHTQHLLYVARDANGPWDAVDLAVTSCFGHVVGAALVAYDAQAALVQENASLVADRGQPRGLIGSSPPTQQLLDFVAKAGPSDATILLTGESGAGKEMVARALHRTSRRSKSPFIAINCAALTESLIESELFGHEKGAFTGATERKQGRFELADHGTLFLDEVGELPLRCQTKFLRVLEEQTFQRVGGGAEIGVDVRVIAATNRDLREMVDAKQFRDDLYYRLSVIHTRVPSLRERPHDIDELAHHFLERFRTQAPRRVRGFTDEALDHLRAYAWPGNVRELRNVIERALVLGNNDMITPQDLPDDIRGAATGPGHAAADDAQPRALRDLERDGIAAALRATAGNKAQAAAILGIDRSTLYKKLRDYNL